MIDMKKTRGHCLVADQRGIDELKNEFMEESREFVYYRKGEWHGAETSIRHAVEWAKAHPEWVSVAIAMYEPSKDVVPLIAQALGRAASSVEKTLRHYFGPPIPLHVTRRVIVGKSIRRRVVEEWEAECGKGGVVTIPKSQQGVWRYIVNEKRYAIFTRFGENDLRGIIGNDRTMIQTLREMFDFEFIIADQRNKLT